MKSNELWDLDSRHLAALVTIADTRSISRAAEELGYGQSAVSQQLAALERVVGHRLVDRGSGPKPVTLTEAGEAMLVHARWILDRLAIARAEMDALARGAAGTLRIGTFQSAGARLLPSVLAAFRERWPDVVVSIHLESRDGELTEMLRDGALDVAFVESGVLAPDLGSVELMKDRFVALVPPGHRLASKQAVSLRDLDGEDVVHGDANDSCTLKGEVALRDAAADVRVVFRTGDNATRQRLVDAGLGCAVLPGLTVEPGLERGAVIVPLVEDINRTVCLAWASARTRSFAAERFCETAVGILRDAGADRAVAPATPSTKRAKR